MGLKLKAAFNFAGTNHDNVIVLEGFLPEQTDDGLRLSLRNGRFSALVYMSDRRKQKGNITDPPTDPNELKKHMTLMVRGLTVELEDATPPADVKADLETDEATERKTSYVLEVTDIVAQIHNGIVEFFRNYANQTWLEPIKSNPRIEKTRQYAATEFALQFLASNGQWAPIIVGGPALVLTSRNYFGEPVNREEWNQLTPFVQSFVETGNRANLLYTLLANSQKHLDEMDGRLALIEAVAALESVIQRSLVTAIFRQTNPPKIERKDIDRLIEKAGLRAAATVVLKCMADEVGFAGNDIDQAIKAIGYRNEIIHHGKLSVKIEEAASCIAAVAKISKLIEKLAQKDSGNVPVVSTKPKLIASVKHHDE
jgi:hypothetical protein